ncbi:MAG: EAL domain-containing protein [Acidiferrobacterales bacterium]
MAVNLDTWQILDNAILDILHDVDGAGLVVEWTEFHPLRVRDRDLSEAAVRLNQLRLMTGVKISIDDAGAGIDAIQRMSLVRPDFLKLDGHLFRRAEACHRVRSLVRGLLDMAHTLGAESVVEWIETETARDLARSLGARLGQGYLWPRRDVANEFPVPEHGQHKKETTAARSATLGETDIGVGEISPTLVLDKTRSIG